MADLTNILGGNWSPPSEGSNLTPEQQLADAIAASGLAPPANILLDGRVHRFRSGAKGSGGSGDKAGWYIAYADGVPAGRFGCWRAGIESAWRADIGRKLTPAEEMAHIRRMTEAKAARDAALAMQREVAANTVETIWTDCVGAHADHPYLRRKGIQPHGARVTGDGRLVVPLYRPDGGLSSLQYIDPEGGKLYHPGAQTGGCFWTIGAADEPGPIYIAEGFATAATIHEVTKRPVIVAYSASNLVPVTGEIRQRYGATQDIVIVADNDASGVGQRYAEQASAKHGARMVMPPIPGDANDYVAAGNDLAALLDPPIDDWLIPADDFCAQPAPISWLVKRWIQSDALIMVHGPSGGGKTFVVLDWCLHIASGRSDWRGQKVRPGTVVYLAGEGHHGLRSRVAAWKQHNKAASFDMWISKDGCDLNTAEGYSRVVENIRSLPRRPHMVVVDTLHRFLNGDENSAQDAKTMLDACNAIMREFGCSVVLVHHTGVSEEAQHRARGSSAWRGALDIEISVVPAKGDEPIQLVQRKSKDAELADPLFARLEKVDIEGWLDEDGAPVSSAVPVEAAPPVTAKKDSKIDGHRKAFENAWWSSGAEERNGLPYVTRSAMVDYLINHLDITPASARVYIKPSATGKPIADLLLAHIIEPIENGWIVTNEADASAMMMRKMGGN
jgi:putative DNA primase/helicase